MATETRKLIALDREWFTDPDFLHPRDTDPRNFVSATDAAQWLSPMLYERRVTARLTRFS